jgi:hypothetical protein
MLSKMPVASLSRWKQLLKRLLQEKITCDWMHPWKMPKSARQLEHFAKLGRKDTLANHCCSGITVIPLARAASFLLATRSHSRQLKPCASMFQQTYTTNCCEFFLSTLAEGISHCISCCHIARDKSMLWWRNSSSEIAFLSEFGRLGLRLCADTKACMLQAVCRGRTGQQLRGPALPRPQ